MITENYTPNGAFFRVFVLGILFAFIITSLPKDGVPFFVESIDEQRRSMGSVTLESLHKSGKDKLFVIEKPVPMIRPQGTYYVKIRRLSDDLVFGVLTQDQENLKIGTEVWVEKIVYDQTANGEDGVIYFLDHVIKKDSS